MEIHLGSVLSRDPDREYLASKKSYHMQEWFITSSGNEKLFVVKKTFLTKQEQTFNWIELFDKVFLQSIIQDAKRIAYDVFTEKGKNPNMSPSTFALVSLYISSEFHDENFENKIIQVIDVLRSEKMKYMFGRRNSELKYGSPQGVYDVVKKIKMHSDDIKKLLGPEKINRLKEMWRGINA